MIRKLAVGCAIGLLIGACSSSKTPTDGGPGGQSPDAGGQTPDGGGVIPPLGPYPNSAETKRILAAAAQVRAGNAADFSTDGTAVLVPVPDGAGGVTVTQTPDGGMGTFTFTYDSSANTTTYALDPAGDGTGAISIVTDLAAHQTVTTEDTDFDGTPDYQLTQTVNPTAHTVEVVVSMLDGGELEAVSDATVSADLPAGCSDGVGPGQFPGSAPDQVDGPFNIKTSLGEADPSGGSNDGSTDGADGSCSNAHALELEKAIDCALSTGAECLRGTNSSAAFLLDVALSYGSVNISCGNGCAGGTTFGQNTCGPGSSGCDPTDMAFNPSGLDKNSDASNCDSMLHEMLHWAGDSIDDSTHNSGTDQVYACGRYCGGCDEGGPYTPPGQGITKNTDCATCAGSQAERAACGTFTKVDPMPPPMRGICHNGLGCIAADCLMPFELNTVDCNGKPIPNLAATAECCQTCPSGCTESNDLPCTGNMMASPQQMCTGATPYCG